MASAFMAYLFRSIRTTGALTFVRLTFAASVLTSTYFASSLTLKDANGVTSLRKIVSLSTSFFCSEFWLDCLGSDMMLWDAFLGGEIVFWVVIEVNCFIDL